MEREVHDQESFPVKLVDRELLGQKILEGLQGGCLFDFTKIIFVNVQL